MLADRYCWAGPLIDLMRSMTQREYEARLAWLEEEQSRPSQTDWYLMQVAMQIKRGYVKDPNSVKLEDMRLVKAKPEKPVTKAEAVARAKSRWFGMLGVKKEKRHG
jgi:hypothetical protein